MKYYLSLNGKPNELNSVKWTNDQKALTDLEAIDDFTTRFNNVGEMRLALCKDPMTGVAPNSNDFRIRYETASGNKKGKVGSLSYGVAYSSAKPYLSGSALETYITDLIELNKYEGEELERKIKERSTLIKAMQNASYGKVKPLIADLADLAAYMQSRDYEYGSDYREICKVVQHLRDFLLHVPSYPDGYHKPYVLKKDKSGAVVTRYRTVHDLGMFILNQETKYREANYIKVINGKKVDITTGEVLDEQEVNVGGKQKVFQKEGFTPITGIQLSLFD